MSLRLRLMLLFGGLLVVMLAAAWWWSQWLTRNLTGELDQVALSVGRSVVSVIGEDEIFEHQVEPDTHTRVDVLVERTVEHDDGRKVTAVHRQQDGQITGFSVQVDDQPASFVKLPVDTRFNIQTVSEFKFETTRETDDGSPALRLLSDRLIHDIPIPEQGTERLIDNFARQLFGGLVALFAAGLLIAAFIAHRVSDPLRRLQAAADRVGHGERGVQVNGQGVSEVNSAIRAFNQMSLQLEQLEDTRRSLRAKEHFSEIGEIGRGLAHSLRNPLNAIGLTLEELAARAGDEPENQELAQGARQQIRRIDESIRAFLALANAGSTEAEPVAILEVIQDVALEVIQQAGHDVDVEIDGQSKAIELAGLNTEIRAMIQALVINAVEASPASGKVEVALSSPSPERCLVEVSDRGPGLDPEIKAHLFEPHATTKADGSGMGLYLTQRLATTRYGGTLALEPRTGGGLCAVLELGQRHTDTTLT
jgi:signal transduction histidine kinase